MEAMLPNQPLSPANHAAITRLLTRFARSQEPIEQALDLLDRFADSGNLAALSGFFEDFDENFNAITRPDLMSMIANLMMLMGALSQIDYAPFFALAMKTPAAVNASYANFELRTKKLGLREALEIVRRPEVAAALQTFAEVLRSLRPATASPSEQTP